MAAAPDGRTDDRRRELEDAFGAFAQASLRLEGSYQALEARVERLTEALARAREDKQRQAADHTRIERCFEGLLEALPGGVIVLDGRNRVCHANPAAVELLGEPLVGVSWQDISGRAFKALDRGGEILLQDGRRLALSRRDLSVETGQIILLTETTDRQVLEELMQRHDRLSAMGEMAASLAHQIRTPLASALLYATSAADPSLDESVRESLVGKLVDRLHDLEHLIDDMLLFARGGGQTSEAIDVSGLLSEVEACVRPQLGPEQVIDVEVTDATLSLDGNQQALCGAVLNLVTNALDASGPSARVRLTGRPHGLHDIEIAVSDNGPGIDPSHAAKIFTPFFSTRPGGTGLGLAVVRAVAESHGGSVCADRAAGGGARVALRLPLSGSASAEAAA